MAGVHALEFVMALLLAKERYCVGDILVRIDRRYATETACNIVLAEVARIDRYSQHSNKATRVFAGRWHMLKYTPASYTMRGSDWSNTERYLFQFYTCGDRFLGAVVGQLNLDDRYEVRNYMRQLIKQHRSVLNAYLLA